MYPERLQKYIPPEFDLAKYNKAANMPIELWIINILIKLMVYKPYEMGLDLSSVPLSDIEKAMPYFERMIGKGVMTEIDDGLYLMFNDLIKMDKAKYTSQVREVTYYELFNIANDLKTEEMEKLYSEIGKSTSRPLAMFFQNKLGKLNEFVHVYDKYWENNSISLLKIDLDCSDSEVRSAFSDWLKEKRKKQKAASLPKRRSYQIKNLNQVTFRKWYDARVLAYMDLVAWNYVQGNRPTNKIIGDILFPEQRDLKDTTSAVSDVVKPLAIKLANITTIKRMIKAFAEENRQKMT